jgi:CheY-like chemotaxis protein
VKAEKDPASRRPTPVPQFDVTEFARESDSKVRALSPRELAPVRERALRDGLALHAHRTALVRALLRVGGVSRVEGARALRAELRALEQEANLANDEELEAMAYALRLAIEELGGLTDDCEVARDAVVWVGADALARDHIAVAAETQGVGVRVATAADAFWAQCQERRPDIVVLDADVTGFSAEELCKQVREAAPGVPVVLLARGLSSDDLGALEQRTRAARCLDVDVGSDALIAVFAELLPRAPRPAS